MIGLLLPAKGRAKTLGDPSLIKPAAETTTDRGVHYRRGRLGVEECADSIEEHNGGKRGGTRHDGGSTGVKLFLEPRDASFQLTQKELQTPA